MPLSFLFTITLGTYLMFGWYVLEFRQIMNLLYKKENGNIYENVYIPNEYHTYLFK